MLRNNGKDGMMRNKCFNGLSTVNIELTSRCNKSCWMCGRRKIDRDYPEIKTNYGDMDFSLLKKIEKQLPKDIVIQFHNNGEPLLYPKLKEVLQLFEGRIRQFDTNGKLVLEKFNDIVNNLEILTISVIENDPEGDEQYKLVKEFTKLKGSRKPNMVYRLLGDVKESERWYDLPGIIVKRVLHNPLGSFNYKRDPTRPEIGICLDLLHHMVIDRLGNVYPCVRFDPLMEGIIGNANKEKIIDIWNCEKRKTIIKKHLESKRDECIMCKKCDYWGVPTGI